MFYIDNVVMACGGDTSANKFMLALFPGFTDRFMI